MPPWRVDPHNGVVGVEVAVPRDDGAAAHLPGRRLPAVGLAATDGSTVDLSALGPGRTVLYVYPKTGRPGVEPPPEWDRIPGARGCTPEACGFRDHHDALRQAGARVYGLSSQTTDDQREAVERLRLPYPLLADPQLAVGRALGLPTFVAGGETFYRRLTMIARDGVVEHVFYPVFPPDTHAAEVLAWLTSDGRGRPGAAARPGR
ncbi:MAG TPA: peroxiredoxin [Natronosporangium sp.]|nr:peroxiredoxin [Natronosporangium sp.]